MLHRLAHRLGWNVGIVVAATDRQGDVWVGFRCSGCQRISGKTMAHRCEAPDEHAPPDGAFT